MSTLANPIDSVGTRSSLATGYNFRSCEHCGHDLREQMPEFGAQLWACRDCGGIRQWGYMRPADEQVRPALHCDDCEAVTRHRFLRVV
jgi:hypothetical protein